MSKCLVKALKAVNLDQHLGLFRSLGYESAGSLTHFRTEDFQRLKLNEQELLRLISLLDILKEGTNEGKFCSHFQPNNKTNKKSAPIRANWSDETNVDHRPSQSTKSKQSIDRRRPNNSLHPTGRTSSVSMATTNHLNDFIFQRGSTVVSRSSRTVPTKIFGVKSFLNRPVVQHVKVKSYNYGIPTHRRPGTNSHRSIFVSSSHEEMSHSKPAEIYVYARKRPLLSSENNFQDSITVPDNKRVIIAENKANLDCSPMLKKTEFQFDQVFGGDASNRFVFEQTVLPFLSSRQRSNLTYICFGQTGSGKSHTIFGSRSTDGLLVFCTQLLLQEVNDENDLICSFYEIYNNQVYDLNNPGKKLFVREDGNHHVNVIGVTELVVRNVDSLRAIIDEGLARRHHGKSAFNSNSSRSHAIFQISLRNDDQSTDSFKLIFIDLAGSERATDAQNNQRQTRREGAQINCSLLALKECIRSMDMTHSHAPFRQSKLTHILRDSLVGSKTRTCLMANVSPPNDCCQCSLNTLQYASRIRDISMRHRHRIIPVNNIQMDVFEEKVQPTFKPATASTPVHRLTSQPMFVSMQQTDEETRVTKTIDIDWQIADDDPPITGSGDNLRGKSVKIPSQHRQTQPIHRYQQSTHHQSPSSYFPLPQSNVTKRSYNSLRLMHDGGNERHEKKSVSTPMNTPRPLQTSEENVPTKDVRQQREMKKRELLGDFQRDNHLRASRLKKETKEFLHTERDFHNHRDDLLSILSTRLTRSSSVTTPRDTKVNSRDFSQTNRSKGSISSATKTRPNQRLFQSSSSSTTSLVPNTQSEKKTKVKTSSTINLKKFDSTHRRPSDRRDQSERTVPLRVQYNPTSEEREITNEQITKQENSSLILETTTLDQMKSLYDRTLQQAMSPFAAATLNNPWLMSPIHPSPSKEFGLRVSEQLTALRNLLETRLTENEEIKSPSRIPNNNDDDDDDDDEVAKSFNHLITKNNHRVVVQSSSSPSTDEKEHPHLYDRGSLSFQLNELNHARVSSSLTSSMTSTITSNLAAKLETDERQISTSPSMSNKIVVGSSDNEQKTSEESSFRASLFASPILLPPFSRFDSRNSLKDVHDHLLDSGKGSSLFTTGSSFDTLLNSLKTMREKTFDYPLRSTDEQCIPVTE